MTEQTAFPTRAEIIAQNVEARRHSVMLYDINITNYEMAIAILDAQEALDADETAYRARLEELLASERRERKKEALMLSVLETQLNPEGK